MNGSQAVLPTPLGDKTRTIAQNLITRTLETGYGFSAQLDAEVGSQTVTSITAYRRWDNTEIRDGDFLPGAYIGFTQLHDAGPQTGNTFSQEIRLTSPGKQVFDYVIGAYYSRAFSERVFTRNDVVCTAAALPAPTALTPCSSPLAAPSTFPSASADFGSTFKNLAFFGQGIVNVSQNFRLIGGLRYTSDQLDVFHSRNTTLSGPGINPSFPVTPTGTGQPAVPFTGKATNTNWSGKAGAQFNLSHNSMVYGTYARGYKGPAFNVFFNLTATGTNVISPETSDAYEVGMKNTLFGGKLVLNLAGYYAKYHNFQANNPDLVAGVVVTRFTNAGDVSTRGAELDLIWRPARDLNVSGGVAYTDAKVDQFLAAPGAAATAIVPAGTPLAFAPKFKGSLGADYRWRTSGSVDFTFGAQGSFQSSQLASFSPNPVIRQLATIHEYGLVNLSAGIVDVNDRWRVTVQLRNALDQSFAAAITNGGPGGAYRYQIPRDADRYFGVTARINFGK
jgi:iron complex outermembrane receptor protein